MDRDSLKTAFSFWSQYFKEKSEVFLEEFLSYFSKEVSIFAKIYLDNDQLNYLREYLDPDHTGVISLIEYLIFIENYWSIPSKRLHFFKYKFELKNKNFSHGLKSLFLEINVKNKEKKKRAEFIDRTEIYYIGNDPSQNIISLKNIPFQKQIGFVLSEYGYAITDYGKNLNRTMIKIDEKNYQLQNNMVLRFGKSSFFRIKNMFPSANNQNSSRNWIKINMETKTVHQLTDEFYNLKDVKSVMDYKNIKKNLDVKIFENKINFLQLERICHKEVNTWELKEKTEFIIGRSSINPLSVDINLNDMSISKIHCKIGLDSKLGWFISEIEEKRSVLGSYILLANYEDFIENRTSHCHFFEKKLDFYCDSDEILTLIPIFI